jgi:hypothetical protein
MREILKRWQLRAHPFNPATDADGEPYLDDEGGAVSRTFWQLPLNTARDRRFIDFYFDLYDWQKSTLIQNISKQTLFEKFPALSTLREPKSVLVVIQGSDGTGCESLRNLILHKIQEESRALPVVVEVNLDSFNHADNLKEIAQTFYDGYGNSIYRTPTRDELKEIYDEGKDSPNPGAETFYAGMFRRLNTKVRTVQKNARIVLLLKGALKTGGDSYDTWRVIYNSTSSLFQYIIVITTDEIEANSVHTVFRRDNKNVTLIKARELGLNDAKRYLLARLDQERTASVNDPLAPFTEEALTVLFSPGSAAANQAGEARPFNIDMLNRTFLYSVDYHLSKLELKDPAKLKSDELLIGPDTILEVRRRINAGEECPTPNRR